MNAHEKELNSMYLDREDDFNNGLIYFMMRNEMKIIEKSQLRRWSSFVYNIIRI